MRVLAVILLFVFSSISFLYAQDRVTGKPFATRSEMLAQSSMVIVYYPSTIHIRQELIAQFDAIPLDSESKYIALA